jgi:hypothetical protein
MHAPRDVRPTAGLCQLGCVLGDDDEDLDLVVALLDLGLLGAPARVQLADEPVARGEALKRIDDPVGLLVDATHLGVEIDHGGVSPRRADGLRQLVENAAPDVARGHCERDLGGRQTARADAAGRSQPAIQRGPVRLGQRPPRGRQALTLDHDVGRVGAVMPGRRDPVVEV